MGVAYLYNKNMNQKWIERLIELVALDTTNPPGRNYRQAMAMLEPWCREAGLDVELVETPPEIAPDRVNLLAHRRHPGKLRLLVYAHIDVVPADDDWQPFQPRIEKGKIFGRGAADMKGSLIAFLAAAEQVKDQKLPWDLTLMITTDEETNQKAQIDYLLEQKIDRVKGAVFLDIDSTFGYVSIGGLGHISIKITVHGKAVHSGIAHTGINAIEKAVPILNTLMKLKEKVEARFSQIPANPELGIKQMQAKLNTDVIQGGQKVNIVPDRCQIEIDRRLIPEESVDQAKEEIRQALAPLKKEIDFDLEFVHAMAGYGKVSPAAKKLAQIMKEVTGKGELYGVMGSGDLLAMAADYNWQFAGLGVIRDKESNAHGRDENVRIEDLEIVTEILRRFLLQ